MVSNAAKSVEEYLDSLPAERRIVVGAVRDVVRRNLPKGFSETMGYGMIAYNIPLERYPETYNGQPLCYAAIAAQKHHYSLYLTCAYQAADEGDWLKNEFVRAGKQLDMGKSCVRFKSLDDLPLPAIGQLIARTTPERFIAQYEASRAAPRRAASPTRATATKEIAAKTRATSAARPASTRPAAKKRGTSAKRR